MDEELTDFEALRKFRGMSIDERLESVFLHTRTAVRESKGTNRRLDDLNSKTAKATEKLAKHLDEHADQQAGIDYIKVWGARGTGIVIVIAGAAAALGGLDSIIEWFK